MVAVTDRQGLTKKCRVTLKHVVLHDVGHNLAAFRRAVISGHSDETCKKRERNVRAGVPAKTYVGCNGGKEAVHVLHSRPKKHLWTKIWKHMNHSLKRP